MEHAEYVRRARATWDAFNRRDRDAWLRGIPAEFEGHSFLVQGMEGAASRYRGREGAAAWWDNLWSAFEDIQVQIDQVLLIGEHSLELVRLQWTAKASGVQMEDVVAVVNQMRGGRPLYSQSFADPADALEHLADRLRS